MNIDRRVFADGYLPRELIHREPEVGQLSRAFQPALTDSCPHNALISGPSGVGKTVLARHTLDRLRARVPIAYAHVRCLGKQTRTILRDVLRQHPANVTINSLGVPPSTNFVNSCARLSMSRSS